MMYSNDMNPSIGFLRTKPLVVSEVSVVHTSTVQPATRGQNQFHEESNATVSGGYGNARECSRSDRSVTWSAVVWPNHRDIGDCDSFSSFFFNSKMAKRQKLLLLHALSGGTNLGLRKADTIKRNRKKLKISNVLKTSTGI